MTALQSLDLVLPFFLWVFHSPIEIFCMKLTLANPLLHIGQQCFCFQVLAVKLGVPCVMLQSKW